MRWVALVAAVGLLTACAAGVPRQAAKPPHPPAPTKPPLTTTTTPPVTTPRPKPPTAPVQHHEALPWPTFGANNARTRAVTVPGLRPPFHTLWTFHGRTLLELPPVAGYGLLYEESFDGILHAIDLQTGEEKWWYESHRCGWSSPALGDGLVFATFIGDPSCSGLSNGEIAAFSARTGDLRWARHIGPSESSPLVAGGIVYFGDTNGSVYAFDAATGAERWSYDTGSPVKASPSLAHGRLFFGNYAGTFYALDARTGKLIWQNSGHGNFYSSAAVSGGRVYVGSGDESLYCFSAETGAELWSFKTGKYVYASPAVWHGLVLVGSYDHTFYAIDAVTGTPRWDFHANDSISGAASVIDGVVYFSSFDHKTYAVDAASGRRLQTWDDGEYSPAVAAGGRLYLVGLGRIYALAPRSASAGRASVPTT